MREQPLTINFVDEARLEHNGPIYWNLAQSYSEGHFDPSREVFGSVRVLARARSSASAPPTLGRLPTFVQVGEFPYYQGSARGLRNLAKLVQCARKWARQERCIVLRGPGFLSILVWSWLQHYKKPYAVEVLGDFREVFRVIQHPLKRIFWMGFSYVVPKIVGNASAVLYVSRILKQNYPGPSQKVGVVASDVKLYPEWFAEPREYTQVPRPLRISHVGNMDQAYKGHEYLLKAFAFCRDRGLPVCADLIGEGRLRGKFQEQARDLGLNDSVTFHGSVPWGPGLVALLDRSDLFVFCSTSEGLGKALLEAMARGLPAVGTNVGGIPELLPPDVLVPAADAASLANKILEVASNADTMARLSKANYSRALEYRMDVLEPKLVDFYRAVRRELAA